MTAVNQEDVIPELLWQAKELLAYQGRRIKEMEPQAGRERAEAEAHRLLIACEFPSLLRTVVTEADSRRFDGPDSGSTQHRAAWALASRLLGDPGLPDPVDSATSALSAGEFGEETAHAVIAAIMALVHSNRPEAAISWCDAVLPDAARLAADTWSARLLATRAEASLHRGDVPVGIARAEAVFDMIPPQRWGAWIGGPLSCLIAGYTDSGELSAAKDWVQRPVTATIYETVHCLGYLYARGHYHLADGEHRSALADFMSCGRLIASWGLDPDLYPWRFAIAAAYLGVDDHGNALKMIDSQLDKFTAPPAGHARLFSLVDTRSRRRQELREELFGILRETSGRPGFFSTLQRLHWGDVSSAVPDRVAAYKVTDRYARYLDKLSMSEQRVALLAAQGETNQKIAGALSITVSTVEQHLTSTYRKLCVAGRSELRAKLG